MRSSQFLHRWMVRLKDTYYKQRTNVLDKGDIGLKKKNTAHGPRKGVGIEIGVIVFAK